MAIDLRAAMAQLVALAESVDNMQQVYEGVPDSFGKSITAFIAITSNQIEDGGSGLIVCRTSWFHAFGYKVKGAEEEAERNLLDGIVDYIGKFYAARAGDLAGTVESAELDMTIAGDPQYQSVVGQEYRMYPFVVRTKQQQNI